MSKWEPRIYKGDYIERQHQANEDAAICYCEQHFNSFDDPETNYTVCVVGSNASRTSKAWGEYYSSVISDAFDIDDRGIKIGGFGGKGDNNLKHTNMPAILMEPFFLSSHEGIVWLMEYGHWIYSILAFALTDSIKTFFPNGGIVGLSVGHKYKTSNPDDHGARLPLNLNSNYYEADFSDAVINQVASILKRS